MIVYQRMIPALRVSTLVVLAGVVASASASNPLSFTDEAVARGVSYRLGANYVQYGAGMVLSDLDNDGDLDFVIAGAADFSIAVYENDGTGNFTDRSATSGIANGLRTAAMNSADYDNDGDLDILITGWNNPTRLYRNDGNFTFVDVALAAGIDIDAPAMGTSWADVDNDGHLDLYASVRTLTNGDPTRNAFYHNNGDGTFTEMAGPMGIDAEDDPTLLSSFFDYDRDGDDDLYLGTDKGSGGPDSPNGLSNRLYRNDGGTFTEVTAEANAFAYVDCMGIAVGDLDFDGFFDLYVTNTPPGNKLLMHDGVSAYVDETLAADVGSYHVGWGTVFADFDNDTHLDLYVCNMQGPNRLYRGSDTWPLVDEGPTANVDEMSDVFCVSVGDVDGDNDLDMFAGDTKGRVHLYINHSADAATNNWVRFNVEGNEGVDGNNYGIGTCIDIHTDGKSQVREVRSGVNYKVQDEYTLHFGLGDSDLVEHMSVVFHGGEIRTLTNAPVNQTWTIYPESRLGDPNNNGNIDWFELRQAMAARTSPGQTIEPGQEIFDMDGDFDIDLADLAEMGLGLRTPSVFRFNPGP
jgi:ASPIC and UnbV/FG-GAP-like repeat